MYLLNLSNLFLGGINAGLHLIGRVFCYDAVSVSIDAYLYSAGTEPTLTVVLKHGNHLVDCLLWRMASPLALADFVWVSTALSDEIVDVQHLVNAWPLLRYVVG